MEAMRLKGAGVVAIELSFHHPKTLMDDYFPDANGIIKNDTTNNINSFF
jgi:hypothetical protein